MTIVLLLISTYVLVKGDFGNSVMLELIKEEQPTEKEVSDIGIRALFLFLFVLVYAIIYIAYLSVAIKIDPLKIPTMAMIILMFTNFLFASIKESQDKKDKERLIKKYSKKRTLSGTLNNIATIIYLTYAFSVLI